MNHAIQCLRCAASISSYTHQYVGQVRGAVVCPSCHTIIEGFPDSTPPYSVSPGGLSWLSLLDELKATPEGRELYHIFHDTLPQQGLSWRPGQTLLSIQVAQILRNHGVLLADAGVGIGIGKSLAYLIPILRQPLSVFVISTATLVLQNQLYEDISQALTLIHCDPAEVEVLILKGEAHYLCAQRLSRLRTVDENDQAAQKTVKTLDSSQRDELVTWSSGGDTLCRRVSTQARGVLGII